jgi:hypothetical protein
MGQKIPERADPDQCHRLGAAALAERPKRFDSISAPSPDAIIAGRDSGRLLSSRRRA